MSSRVKPAQVPSNPGVSKPSAASKAMMKEATAFPRGGQVIQRRTGRGR